MIMVKNVSVLQTAPGENGYVVSLSGDDFIRSLNVHVNASTKDEAEAMASNFYAGQKFKDLWEIDEALKNAWINR
jgi:hypothetical protein